MLKRLLTLNDLYDYYSSNFTDKVCFNSKDSDDVLVVQVNGNLKFENDEEEPNHKEGLHPVTLKSCHTLENRNGSFISKEVMEKNMPSFSNRPILAFIHEVDGQLEFYKHNMHEDENGEIVYDEVPVGIIPESCNPHLEYDEEKEKDYLVVNGYIFDGYSKAFEILQREGECPCSVEISIRSLSFDGAKKLLIIEDFYFSGVAILGKTPDGEEVKPGMENSAIKLADFSANNNSMLNCEQTKLVEILDKLNTTLSKFEINNFEEGGNRMTLNELLKKYNKTEADIDFEVQGLSGEELEKVFSEKFGEDAEKPEDQENPTETEACGTKKKKCDTTEEEACGTKKKKCDTTEEEACGDKKKKSEEEACGTKKKKCELEFSVTKDGVTKTFELSLREIDDSLHCLVNDTYAESDNTWYSVRTYEDYVIMQDWCNCRYFKQGYKREDDVFSLVGDRVEVYANFLTKEEEDAIKQLRADYASVKDRLDAYEAAEINAQKEAILADDSYANFAETEDFKAIRESMGDLSVEELRTKCDLAFAKLVKENGTFSRKEETETKKVNKVRFSNNVPEEDSINNPYGDYFKSVQ